MQSRNRKWKSCKVLGRDDPFLRRRRVPSIANQMLEQLRLPFAQGVAAWVVAGGIGYVMYIRPKWYPTITYEKAKTFTPKEIAEWNQGQQQLKKR